MLYFIFDVLFGIVVETVLEFADRRKRLGLVLFFALAAMQSMLTFLFLIMTVKQALVKDWMYPLFLMIVTVVITICTCSAWKKVIRHLKKYYFIG